MEGLEQPAPGAVLGPAIEPLVDGLPGPISRPGQVAPRGAGAEDPEDAVDDRAMGLPRATRPVVGRQQGPDDGEVVVAEGMSEFGQGRVGGLTPAFYQALADDHYKKRTVLVEALRAAGLTPHVSDGAYYILARTGPEGHLKGATAAEKSRDLLARTGVASVAGSAFFRPGSSEGESLLRFCFAKKDNELAEAARRLQSLQSSPPTQVVTRSRHSGRSPESPYLL